MPAMPKLSRQRRWQKSLARLGKCVICGRPAKGLRCPVHQRADRLRARNRYRMIQGALKKPQRCSICDRLGHNARTCQKRNR